VGKIGILTPIPLLIANMYIQIRQFCLGLLVALMATACSGNPTSTASITPSVITITSPSLSSPIIPQEAKRIVSLTSLASDILARLDQSKLVGISGSSLLQDKAQLKDLPRVSEGRSLPNLEKVVALKPDLVIGAIGFHDQIADKLKQLGIPSLLYEVKSWESLESLTTTLATTVKADAKPLLDNFRKLQQIESQSELSVLVLVSRQPILSPNKQSWAGDMLAKFKIKNVVAELQGNSPMQGYVTLSAEKILQINPDALILIDTGGEKVLEQFKTQPFWNQLKAVNQNKVYVFDYYGLVNPGSVDAIATASEKLKQVILTKNS
jgi:iron complex transport system substrate-binding protein